MTKFLLELLFFVMRLLKNHDANSHDHHIAKHPCMLAEQMDRYSRMRLATVATSISAHLQYARIYLGGFQALRHEL